MEHILQTSDSVALENYLTDIRYGLNVPAEYVEDGLPFIRALNLKEYGIEGEVLAIPYTPEEVGQDNLLQKGDLLIVRSGANVGDLGIVVGPLVGSAFGSYVIRMRTSDIDPFYLYVYLKSLFGRKQTVRFRSGAAQPNISMPNLERILVFKPSKGRQQEVKNLLLTSYQKRDDAKNLYTKAEALLLTELGLDDLDLSHRLTYAQNASQVWAAGRFDSDYWGTEYTTLLDYLKSRPHHTLAELAGFANGATPRGANYPGEGIPFLRIQNVSKNRLELDDVVFIDRETHTELLRRSQLQPGDVLITITGRIGTSAVVPEDMLVGNINQHIVRMRLRQPVNPYYLAAFLNSRAGLLQTEREAYGTKRGIQPTLTVHSGYDVFHCESVVSHDDTLD